MKRIFFVEDDLSLIHGLSFALRQQQKAGFKALPEMDFRYMKGRIKGGKTT